MTSTDPRAEQRTALVTGAANGIGLQVARTLAGAGMRIVGIDLAVEQLGHEMESIAREHGVATIAAPADLREEEQIRQAVARGVKQFGSIDVLVNNAGIRKTSTFWETPVELWDEIFAVNLRSQFLVTREVLKQSMLQQATLTKMGGKIVFISSIAGRRGSKNSAAYCSSKWGIRGLAFAAAQDLKGKNISVTVITPGRTDTPMARNSEQWNPDIGWLDPTAIAQAVLYFAQQDASVQLPEIHLHHSAEL